MITVDLHVHTRFSDGKNKPQEVVPAAIKKGLKTIGISDHSFTPFSKQYCMHLRQYPRYIRMLHRLKKKYQDSIEVLCGIELDYYSEKQGSGFDYVIGSVHYVKKNGEYIPIDYSAQTLLDAVKKHYHGDIYGLVEDYYGLVGELAEKMQPSIIGHFDLITKFCEQTTLFDQNNPRYVAAWKAAADKLLKANIPFEINTGAISRGYRTTPYPAQDIRDYIVENGGTFIASSDSHNANTLAFAFDSIEEAAVFNPLAYVIK